MPRARTSIAITLLSALIGLGISLSPVPAIASPTPSPTPGAGASATPRKIVVRDSAESSHPQQSLTGTIRKTSTTGSLLSPKVDKPKLPRTAYSVVTSSGSTVPISGKIPATVHTGDIFTGTVAPPVSFSAGSTHPISNATITAENSNTSLPAATHQLDIVVESPAGTAALNSSYSDQAILDMVTQDASYWQQQAGQGVVLWQVGFDINQTIHRYVSTKPCSEDINGIWDDAAVQLGYASAQAYLDAAATGTPRHLLVLLPPGCGSEGIDVGTVGANVNSGGLLEATLGLTVDDVAVAQGLGYNLSVGDANLDYCTDDSLTLGCTNYQAADLMDVMGQPVEGSDYLAALNSATMAQMGWLNSASTVSYSLSPGHDSQSWSVRMNSLGGPGSHSDPTIVTVVDPISGDTYYIEYRGSFYGSQEPMWYGSPIYPVASDGTADVLFSEGIRLLRESGVNGSSVITQPDAQLDYNDASAWWAPTAQDVDQNASMSNPSGSVTVTSTDGGIGTGADVTITLARPTSAATTPVYRFWSNALGAHFYTDDPQEKATIQRRWSTTWSYEGIAYNAFANQVDGTVPLYRFWSAQLGDHFYTTSANERDYILRTWPTTWSFEGVAYYVYPENTTAPNTVSVARFWSAALHTHFYTDDPVERDTVLSRWPTTWNFEDNEFRVPYAP